MKSLQISLLLIAGITLFSCSDSYKTHDTGLKYKIFVENKDREKPVDGDILVLKMTYRTEKDSVLFSTKDISGPFRMRMKQPSHNGGSIEDAFAMLHVGDSGRFLIDAINFFELTKKVQRPLFVKEGDKLIFDLKLEKILKSDQLEEEVRALHHASEAEEYKLLENYLKVTNIQTKPEPSGLYYIEEQAGKGKPTAKGKKAYVHYIGTFIDGKVFDTSYERNEPFSFTIGANEAIQGMEEGVMKMKAGGKAKLIIPSKLAYGEKQKGPVAPFSTLVFEVELLEVK
ncbi:MAG: hypothetical protein A2275_02995 [Bacteroidetes bacterium RIFOXYA12_FULL_35_11]|nr:MAG: hypothetical protein A2X01_01950 [Bacteroidetes bacterium GWF2_35_48]OFY75745.1 MAG: hypothetical protein A2275_02995 [Bacteroidetes bacterium RIFOXYA12_FULL_35_11]OFY97587.1 MAG: hypothetical protein A2309_07855 [Bacteroidetes bacterium RIFOXYB2_FULL_35_7]OFZ00372.1 MAG: hypothetical protein A2491_12390 [Bacteroidetes bacterium RIFOXYC12_FULL_35_7]HBX51504.1 hypothetical protein [Bacteroidales bacterium]